MAKGGYAKYNPGDTKTKTPHFLEDTGKASKRKVRHIDEVGMTDMTMPELMRAGLVKDPSKGKVKAKRKKDASRSKKDFIKGQKAMTSEFGAKGGKKKAIATKAEGSVKPKVKKRDFSVDGMSRDDYIKKHGAKAYLDKRRKSRKRAGVKEKLAKAKPTKDIAFKKRDKDLFATKSKIEKVKASDKKEKSSAEIYEDKMKKKGKFGKKRPLLSAFRKLKAKAQKRFDGGGYVNPENPMKPTSSIPARPPFRQGVRMMGHGGQVSVSNDKAGAGDVHTTHSHSGYKAGE